MERFFNWVFGNKAEKYKIGDRVHLKGDKVESLFKREIQPHPDVYVVRDVHDTLGYDLLKEDTCLVLEKIGGIWDKNLIPAPDDHKNLHFLSLIEKIKPITIKERAE